MFMFFVKVFFCFFVVLVAVQLMYEVAVIVAPFVIALVLIALTIWVVRLVRKRRA